MNDQNNKGTRRIIEVIVEECAGKHQLHPFEPDLNADYNIELTFSIQELRNFMIEHDNLWNGTETVRKILQADEALTRNLTRTSEE